MKLWLPVGLPLRSENQAQSSGILNKVAHHQGEYGLLGKLQMRC